MADYYQELLGETMPLSTPEVPEQEPSTETATAAETKGDAAPAISPVEGTPNTTPQPDTHHGSLMAATAPGKLSHVDLAKPKPLFESRTVSRSVAELREPVELPKTVVSPIIPAAFPKLAPQTKESLDTQTASEEVRPETISQSAPDLDQVVPVETEAKTSEAPAAPEKTEVIAPTEQQVAHVDESVDQDQVMQIDSKEPRPWLDNGRPEWGQERFECLLFSVAGLKLAVPLISLGSIHKLDKDLTPLVGRASWFMGLYRWGDRNIQVVDTAKWVMPDRYHDEVKEGYHFIIRLGDSNWGMACDSVDQAIQLEPTQVKWRTERSKRPWLSGTVIDHMCALLDADTLGWLLDKDARKQ